ncbi:intraflagellar transport protein 43 homolog [Clonorchis sinensis]|uniref:Intraflagellar transport protein 43 homolog n=1 Tax=Clonorchis sinensis TaxID=79923 RepID=G7Y2K0_CLOSI|nr:intraflagellar transport protein 43 homolog [Clonorchis sinensis]
MNRLISYQELNADLRQGVAFQLLDNEINLKLLTSFLSPESAVQEVKFLYSQSILCSHRRTKSGTGID